MKRKIIILIGIVTIVLLIGAVGLKIHTKEESSYESPSIESASAEQEVEACEEIPAIEEEEFVSTEEEIVIEEDTTIEATELSLVEEAYNTAINLNEDNVNDSPYVYFGISSEEEIRCEDDSIYNSLAMKLEGFYMFGETYYGNWNESYCTLILGIEKKETWEEMKVDVDKASTLISRDSTFGTIMRALEQVSCVEGTFDYETGTFEFVMTDFQQASLEFGVTEEMLGYTLAALNVYGAEGEFSEEGFSCSVKWYGSLEDL